MVSGSRVVDGVGVGVGVGVVAEERGVPVGR